MARGSRGADADPDDRPGDNPGDDPGNGPGDDPGNGPGDSPGEPGHGPCEFCKGHHDPSVHTVRHSVGGGDDGGGGGSDEGSSADADVYVELDTLAIAGRRLFVAAEGLDERVLACLRRVRSLEAGLLAGGDETGRAFHHGRGSGTGYDASSRLVCESLGAIPLAYKVHGVAVQGAAKAYADTDDSSAADTSTYLGVWGT